MMPRQLFLLRHAKSNWQDLNKPDFERGLASRGQRDAPRIGNWLRQQGLIPDYVLSSPARRAKKTVKLVAQELAFDPAEIRWDERIYAASHDTLLEVLAECPVGRVLLVGHNPGLEDLLLYLLESGLEPTADGKFLPTASVAVIEMPDDWQRLTPGVGHFLSLMRPKWLPDASWHE